MASDSDRKLILEIEVDDGTVKQSFRSVEKEGDKTASKLKNTFSSASLFSGLKRGLTSLTTQLLAFGAALAGAFAVREIIAAANRQEDAINQLNTSLRLAGTFSEEASKSIQEFAAEIERTTVVGDEAALELFALARNLTKTNEEAQKLTKAAIELSSATGGKISLESAVSNLGKSLGGMLGELGEVLPVLKTLEVDALRSGAALDFVLQRFGGAASAQVKTFSGAVAQARNSFGTFLENLGLLATKSPAVIAIVNAISSTFNKLSESVSRTNSIGQIISPEAVRSAINSLVEFLDIISNVSNGVIGIFELIRTGFDFVVARLSFAVANIAKALNFIGEITGTFKIKAISEIEDFAKSFDKATFEAANSAIENFASVGGASRVGNFVRTFGVEFEKSLKKLNETTEVQVNNINQTLSKTGNGLDVASIKQKLNALIAELDNVGLTEEEIIRRQYDRRLQLLKEAREAGLATDQQYNDLVNKANQDQEEKLNNINDRFKELSKNINNIVNQGIVNGLSSGFQKVGQALVKGGSAFDSFGNFVLSILGDILIAVGQAMLGVAVALLNLDIALKTLNPATAFIVAAAVIALGAALKAMGDSASPDGGGVSLQPGTPGGNPSQPVAVDGPGVGEIEGQGTGINLTIQGDVLDSEESGLRIVNIINSAYDKQGVTIKRGVTA